MSVGFGCEVTHAFVGEDTVLGHQVGIGHCIIGTDAHLSANLVIAAISLCNYDMRVPVKEIVLHGPVDEPAYRCTTSQFGGLIGDHVQTGSMITIGPGTAVGRHSAIAASVCMGSSIVPAASVVRSSSREVTIEPSDRPRQLTLRPRDGTAATANGCTTGLHGRSAPVGTTGGG
ncbi:hypothetical protein [Streptomyces sp. NPDC101206]|uniref:hypothetical protein n=1 Tax=Streptomyces sp. NPDC101206 TaxID=3366128 RepID=UPI0037F99CC0